MLTFVGEFSCSDIRIEGDGPFVVDSVTGHNLHDTLRVTGRRDTPFFAVRNSWFTYVRDDGVDNNDLVSGVVENNLFGGVYTGVSARTSSSVDGSDELMIIENNLFHMQAQPGPHHGDTRWNWSPGDDVGFGNAFKWSSDSPEVILRNNIFLVDEADEGTWGLRKDKLRESENNIIVYTGSGDPFKDMDLLPDNIQITNDLSVWENARRDWIVNHPNLYQGPMWDGRKDRFAFWSDASSWVAEETGYAGQLQDRRAVIRDSLHGDRTLVTPWHEIELDLLIWKNPAGQHENRILLGNNLRVGSFDLEPGDGNQIIDLAGSTLYGDHLLIRDQGIVLETSQPGGRYVHDWAGGVAIQHGQHSVIGQGVTIEAQGFGDADFGNSARQRQTWKDGSTLIIGGFGGDVRHTPPGQDIDREGASMTSRGFDTSLYNLQVGPTAGEHEHGRGDDGAAFFAMEPRTGDARFIPYVVRNDVKLVPTDEVSAMHPQKNEVPRIRWQHRAGLDPELWVGGSFIDAGQTAGGTEIAGLEKYGWDIQTHNDNDHLIFFNASPDHPQILDMRRDETYDPDDDRTWPNALNIRIGTDPDDVAHHNTAGLAAAHLANDLGYGTGNVLLARRLGTEGRVSVRNNATLDIAHHELYARQFELRSYTGDDVPTLALALHDTGEQGIFTIGDGGLTLNKFNLVINAVGSQWHHPIDLVLFQYQGELHGSPEIGNVTAPEGFSYGQLTHGQGQIILTDVVIPEPGTLAVLGLGGLMLLNRRRRPHPPAKGDMA